jgi:hypothetical protein
MTCQRDKGYGSSFVGGRTGIRSALHIQFHVAYDKQHALYLLLTTNHKCMSNVVTRP